jgi:hypothetical protein
VTQHTPGPWMITDIDRVYNGEIIKSGSNWIAVVSDFNRFDRDDERMANAALIAAAPELLEALMKFIAAWERPGSIESDDSIDDLESTYNAARAAIAKVEATK